MNNIVSPLATIIESLIETMNSVRAGLYVEANARKAALAKAVADMQEARAVMNEFVASTAIIADAANEFSEDMEQSCSHIHTMLSDMDVFETPIEDFDGLCEVCGKELRRDEEQYIDEDDNGFICVECERKLYPEIESNDELPSSESKEA